ncbi:putative transcription factor interactor and regulator CCHC(Zn) family [Helianthus anomalus]
MKSSFWKQTNREFLAKKKQDELKNDAVKKKETRTCFQCYTSGHLAKDCSKAFRPKQGVSHKLKKKVVEDVKKSVDSSSDNSDRAKSEELSSGDESDSTKSDEPQVEEKGEKSVPTVDDVNFPPLRAENFKKQIGKVEISNQFYSDKKVFDVENAFNPKVKHIFGKMIDRKVKGVKEFYEKKMGGKKPSVGSSVTPKAGQAWVDSFFD